MENGCMHAPGTCNCYSTPASPLSPIAAECARLSEANGALTAENERLKRALEAKGRELDMVATERHRDTFALLGERDRYRTALETAGALARDALVAPMADESYQEMDRLRAILRDIARGARALTSTTPPPAAEPAKSWPDEPVCGACLCHCPNCARPAVATSSYLDQTLDQARDALGNALYPGLNGDAPKGTANTLWAFAMEAARRLAAAPPVALRPARDAAMTVARDYLGDEDMPEVRLLAGRITAAIEADRTQRTGLDQATVEACAKAVDAALKDAYRRKVMLENAPRLDDATWQYASGVVSGLNGAAARIRSLAAQPRGEKL